MAVLEMIVRNAISTPDRPAVRARAPRRGTPVDRPLWRAAGALLLAALFLAMPGRPVQAETLKQALESAYVNNPELQAERARLRAEDENVSQARSQWRPSVSGAGDAAATRQKTFLYAVPPPGTTHFSPRGYSITVTQPIFSGFRTLHSVKQADAAVRAVREALLNKEQDILFAAAQAYMDVVRDRSIVSLRQNNVKVLNEQLRATKDRFSVGEVTRTDTAQAEARLSLGVSNLNVAVANLNTSKAVYTRVIGHPVNVVGQPPSIASRLPNSLNEAQLIADTEHPAIGTAQYTVDAAVHGVDLTTGALLPTVSLEASYGQRYEPSATTRRNDAATVTGRVTVPLYQKGTVSSKVRQAKDILDQRRFDLERTRNEVKAAAISTWGQLDAARAQIRSAEALVKANQVALAGVREEAKVGQRTVLDVLDAEQELLDARVSLVTSKRDYVVASYALLAATGRLSARRLALNVEIYDPLIHYNKVRRKWFGLGQPVND